MGKTHRGRPLREETPNGNRGTCPVTGRSGVKLLYEAEIDGKKVMVSKKGKATLNNAKKRAEDAQKNKGVQAEPAAAEAE
jgi:hypothetical protein